MDLQFVFGNPRRKNVAKHKKNDKIKTREVNVVKKKVLKKTKRRNPYAVKKDPVTGAVLDISQKYMSEGQITRLKNKIERSKKTLKERQAIVDSIQRTLDKAVPAIGSARSKYNAVTAKLVDWQSNGFDVDILADKLVEGKKVAKKTTKKKVAKKATKKKVTKKATKKKATKKKATKKATKKKSGKMSAAAKKKFLARMAAGRKKAAAKKKRKPAKKKAVKKAVKKKVVKKKVAKKVKRKVAKKAVKKTVKSKTKKKVSRKPKKSLTVSIKQKGRKRQSITVKNPKRKKRKVMKRKRNPMIGGASVQAQVEKYLGMDLKEAGSLALGGATYGAVNSALARFAAPVHNILIKVPVIGSAMPTLMVGAVLNFFGERQSMDILKTLGKGLIGSSVVGMGVNASQMVPGLKPAELAGYDAPQLGYAAPQLGYDADFGGVDYTPDMSGVDYTPDMSGVDYTPDMGSDADFGEYEESDADFGGIPEGMM